MSKIRIVDLRLLEDIFASDRGAGYVLDFTDRSFSAFFSSELHVVIIHKRGSLDDWGSKRGGSRTCRPLEAARVPGWIVPVLPGEDHHLPHHLSGLVGGLVVYVLQHPGKLIALGLLVPLVVSSGAALILYSATRESVELNAAIIESAGE